MVHKTKDIYIYYIIDILLRAVKQKTKPTIIIYILNRKCELYRIFLAYQQCKFIRSDGEREPE